MLSGAPSPERSLVFRNQVYKSLPNRYFKWSEQKGSQKSKFDARLHCRVGLGLFWQQFDIGWPSLQLYR